MKSLRLFSGIFLRHVCDLMGACVGCQGQAIMCVERSVGCVRVLRVNKWEALEFFLVQVGYKLLIWGGQLWGVACEKTIKVLSFAPTLPWRGEHRERHGERERERGGERMEWVQCSGGRCGGKKGQQTNKQTTERKKRNTTKKNGNNQSNHSQPRLWISIGPCVSRWHFSVIIGRYANRHGLSLSG